MSGRVILIISWTTEFFLFIRLLQLHRTIVCQESELPDELLYGRAGYLYALLYLNTEIGPGTVCESAIKEVMWDHDLWALTALYLHSLIDGL